MIFPPESIYELRHELAEKMESGELTEAEVFRQALAVDPSDPAALRFHAMMAEADGDRAAAEQYGRRFILADPTSHEGYLLLGRVLSDRPLADAYHALGKEKLHYFPDAHQTDTHQEDAHQEDDTAPQPATQPAASDEPESVARELEPHRLIHQLFVAGVDAIEPALVDRIVAVGADSAPLLLGILNAFGEDILRETDDALVVRSLALLGEIGDPANLPALAKFVGMEDETMGGAARWAFLRIARLKPEATIEVVRTLTVGAEALDLAGLAQQLCLMPDVPGRKEALLGLAMNLPELDEDGAALVVVSMITSAYVMEGANGELAASIEKEYGSHLNREARKELKVIRSEIDAARQSWTDDEPSIYQVICDEFEAADDDQTVVRQEPKLGRNDPCWCGSGKKYKKCHLDEDSAR
ncbi:MAG: motif domain protein [Candidatus Solibacter sp.]|nr:motif domain protein [Candidatus Solibacter sp.]